MTPAPPARPTNTVGVIAFVFTVLSVNVIFPLLTPAKHYPDIVALEFAPFEGEQRAEEIIRIWAADERVEKAKWNVRFDYLFIVAYSATLYFACRWAGREYAADGLTRLAAAAARWIAWGQVAAGGCDAVENVFLLLMLELRSNVNALAVWECGFATTKAVLIFVGLLYVLVAVARAAGRVFAR